MKKLFLIIAAFVGFQLSAQVKSIEGLKLTKVEEGLFDFTIKNDDYKAHKLVKSLAEECTAYTAIPQEVIGKDGICGYFFHFEDCDVLYILLRGGTVKGSVIEKKKGA
jgi:hypothetical protein